ncbi:MAG: hypothetical protein NTZ53_14665 [Cyanobacteria bacterium]|nr:hypothetical protein [Cyanobacteriota bacterium]
MDLIVLKPLHPLGIPLAFLLLAAAVMEFVSGNLPLGRVAYLQPKD